MGVVVKGELCKKVVEVSDRVMAVVLVFEEDVLWLICGYAPQSGRRFKEKQSFYDDLKYEWHSAGNLVMFLGDFSGHVGRHIDGLVGVHGGYGVGLVGVHGGYGVGLVGVHGGYGVGLVGVHGGYGVGQRICKEDFFVFCLENKLCMLNTWFR